MIKKLSILRQAKNSAIKELNESFNLKFGEVIDLNILDSLKSTKRLGELKIELKEKTKIA